MTFVGIAATQTWVVTGSAEKWAGVIAAFSFFALGSAAIGGIVGFLARGTGAGQFLATGIASLAFFAAMAAISPVGFGWAPQHPLVSALHLVGPFIWFFFAPAVIASFLLGRWAIRRYPRRRKVI